MNDSKDAGEWLGAAFAFLAALAEPVVVQRGERDS